MVNFSILIIALFITIVMVPLFRGLAYRMNALDQPDERKVHIRPMARTGGLAMAVGILVPLVLWAPPVSFLRALLFASSIIVAAGFVDDIVTLGPRVKLGAQAFAAAVIVFYGGVKIQSLGSLLPEGWFLAEWVSVALTLLVVVGVTNAINLADGLDGLAGGISIIVFIVLGYSGYIVGNSVIALVSAAIIGAIFGFLRFNTYPATIFMGDAGSQLLGFLAIVLALKLTQGNIALSPALPLLLLGFPILDTMTVMLARIYHGRSPFSADKNHFHHKLMRLGLSHSEAVLTIYFLQTALVLMAYGMRYCSDWLIVGVYAFFIVVISLFFFLSAHFKWRFRRRQEGEYNHLQKRLQELGKLTLMLRIIFYLLQINFILVLLIIVWPAHAVPAWLAGVALVLAILLLLGFVKQVSFKLNCILLRLSVYLTLPALLYDTVVSGSFSEGCLWWREYGFYCDIAYFTLVVLSLLLLKFTRRSGYKSTPLDFLILLVVLLVPVINPQTTGSGGVGMMAVRIIVFFFTFEVIIEESRRTNWWLDMAVIGSLLLVGWKWVQFI